MKRSIPPRSSGGSVDSSGARRSLLASAPVGMVTVRTCKQVGAAAGWDHKNRAHSTVDASFSGCLELG